MDIALLPDYRNAGIGLSLLQDILEEGKNLNLPVTIHVETVQSSDALISADRFLSKRR